jgi:hypothetical protein
MYDRTIVAATPRSIRVTPGGWAHLMSLSNNRLTFSCNAGGEVWISVCKGNHREDQREHLTGRCALLAQIVEAVARERPLGGRFTIDDRRAVLEVDGSSVVDFI